MDAGVSPPYGKDVRARARARIDLKLSAAPENQGSSVSLLFPLSEHQIPHAYRAQQIHKILKYTQIHHTNPTVPTVPG